LLVNPDSPNAERVTRDTQRAARAKGIQLHILKVGAEGEIEAAFPALVELHAGGLVVEADPFLGSRREQIARLAVSHALPAIYVERQGPEVGGLVSYGISFADIYRQAGIYVGRILKGADPTNLPVQEPTKFELVINLKTAKALGLTLPQSLLQRADEVIE
jgi:putative ABC transport system substrate-binding protein